jgi:Mn-dependent DtxR family transcriptional regulator
MLQRLTELGWLDRVGRRRWEVTADGDRVLNEMGVTT